MRQLCTYCVGHRVDVYSETFGKFVSSIVTDVLKDGSMIVVFEHDGARCTKTIPLDAQLKQTWPSTQKLEADIWPHMDRTNSSGRSAQEPVGQCGIDEYWTALLQQSAQKLEEHFYRFEDCLEGTINGCFKSCWSAV